MFFYHLTILNYKCLRDDTIIFISFGRRELVVVKSDFMNFGFLFYVYLILYLLTLLKELCYLILMEVVI